MTWRPEGELDMRSSAECGAVSKEHPSPTPKRGAGRPLPALLPTVAGGRLGFASSHSPPPVLLGEDVVGHALENRGSREDAPGLYHALKAGKISHLSTRDKKAFPCVLAARVPAAEKAAKSCSGSFKRICPGKPAEQEP